MPSLPHENALIVGGPPYWRRPPMRCPGCLEVLHPEHQPVPHLERFATRCQACRTVVRFVQEDILPPAPPETEYPSIWVPMLLEDRRSRCTPRALWEPCESGWQSLGGSGARTFGFADPSATLCEYPVRGERVRIEKRWEIDVAPEPLVSVTFSHGELWAVTTNGGVHVFQAAPVAPVAASAPRPVELSPTQLTMAVAHPPCVRGAWWFFVSTGNTAKFLYRNPRLRRVREWPIFAHTLPTGWSWRGAPFAVDGRSGGPTFAALAESPEGQTILFVFVLPEEPTGEHMPLSPVQVGVPHAINVPVQIPHSYARAGDTQAGRLRGHLVWVDRDGSVFTIDAAGHPREWTSTQLATSSGLLPPRGALPPLPSLPSLPPLPTTSPGLPPLPTPPAGAATRLAALFDDCLCVTVEPFAPTHDATGKGGIRLWSIQRNEFERADRSRGVAVRALCLEGGPSAERSWFPLPRGPALVSAEQVANGRGMVSVAALPVYVEPLRTEAGRKTMHLAQLIAIASHNAVDVYFRNNIVSPQTEPREARVPNDALACPPLLTPYGVVVPWKAMLETWTFDVQGIAVGDHLPGLWSDRRATARGLDRPLLPIRTDAAGGGRVYPTLIGNRMWIPSDDGKLHCVDLLPERLLLDEPPTDRSP